MWFRVLKKPISDIHDKMDVPKDMRTIATPYEGVIDKSHWRVKNPLASVQANKRQPHGGTGSKPFGLWYGLGTQWVDWVCANMGCETYKYFYEVKIVGNVLQLKTKQDHIDFWEKYKDDKFRVVESNRRYDRKRQPNLENLRDAWKTYDWLPMINWARVQQDYDGIEVMGDKFHYAALYDNVYTYEKEGDKDFPRGSIKWVTSWDVDSGCVWNIDAIEIGQLLFSEDDPEWKPVEYNEDDY